MKIWKVTATAFDYWKNCDRGGYVEVDKYFTTEEKAKAWVEANPRYIFRGFNAEQTEAEDEYQMPAFAITAVEVE